MKCSKIKPKLIDLVLGEINDVTRKKVQQHLASCSSCSKELQELSSTWNKLGQLPEVHSHPQLKMRFYELLEKQKKTLYKEREYPPKKRVFNLAGLRKPVFQTVLLLIIVALSVITGYLLNFNRQQTKEIAKLNEKVNELNQVVTLLAYQNNRRASSLKPILAGASVERSPDLFQILIKTIAGQEIGDLFLSEENALGLNPPGSSFPLLRNDPDSLLVRLFLSLFLDTNVKNF